MTPYTLSRVMPWPFGKKRSDEEKERIRRSLTGLPHTRQRRENISQGMRRWWQRRRDEEETEDQDQQ